MRSLRDRSLRRALQVNASVGRTTRPNPWGTMSRAVRLLGLVLTLLLWQVFAMGTLIDAAGAEFHFLAYAQHRADFDWFDFARPLLLPYVAIAAWAEPAPKKWTSQ